MNDTSGLSPVALLRLADQCVKCGYCLPVCPTFRLYRDEADSPRGRIALIQGWLGGALSPTPRFDAHLDRCLECRACEQVCPSRVRFGALMDGARALRAAHGRGRLARGFWHLLSTARGVVALAAVATLYRRTGVAWLVERLGIARFPRLAFWHELSAAWRWPPARPMSVSAAGASPVGLFLGCVARATHTDTIAALVRVLERLGIAYVVPPTQTCCGGLLRHNGWPRAAEAQLVRNAAAFAGLRALGFASACVAELNAHPALQAVEICRFLRDSPQLAAATVRPLRARVVVHEPCSHRHLLRDTAAVYDLLARIPELEVQPLPGNDQCCGAAGGYLLTQPETAVRLAADKIAAVRALQPACLVTTNTGCAIHLAVQLRAAGLNIPVLHPVELLARQLE